jgi:hypothetical protein
VLKGGEARQGLPISRPNYDWFIATSGDFFSTNNPYYLDGMMDDVRIYNRPLSDSEVWQLYLQEGGFTNRLLNNGRFRGTSNFS